METAGAAHWDDVYRRKGATAVSWFRPHLDVSLALLKAAGLGGARVVDVGGGASTLVDDLLAAGAAHVTVVDLAAEGLAIARARLGDDPRVAWRVGDIGGIALEPGGFDLWHDRAVLHFIHEPDALARYAAQAARAVRPGGGAVIGGFAPDGPERCSGLPVARRDAAAIADILGDAFELVEARAELHTTPAGSPQSFAWVRLRRL